MGRAGVSVSGPEAGRGERDELSLPAAGALHRGDRFDAQCDAIINDETSGRVCVELMLRTMKIIDDAYPRFMRILWP